MTEEILMISEQKLETNKPQPVESLETIPLSPDDDNWQVRVGSQLEGPEKEEVVRCLRAYAEIFVWTPADMPGISPDIISHRLNVQPGARPVEPTCSY